jgi:hypothetical protein
MDGERKAELKARYKEMAFQVEQELFEQPNDLVPFKLP